MEVLLGMFWVVPPPRMPVANEGLVRDPLLKNVIILVVAVTGRGDNPNYVFHRGVFTASPRVL